MKKIVFFAFLVGSSHAVGPHKKQHFAFEVVNGVAMVTGTPESDTESPAPITDQTWENFGVFLQPTGKAPSDSGKINTNKADVTMDMPGGYRANWNAMPTTKKQLGFTGQLNMHYMMYANNWGVGLYGGVGYTGGSVSAQSVSNFDQNVYRNWSVTQVLYAPKGHFWSKLIKKTIADLIIDEASGPDTADDDRLASSAQAKGEQTYSSTAEYHDAVANWPAARVTVKPGLSLQAGIRLGRVVGNFYPHVRLGWAAYKMRAQLSNQMPAGSRQADVYGYCAQSGLGGVSDKGVVYNEEPEIKATDNSETINTTFVVCGANDTESTSPSFDYPKQMLAPFYTSEGLTNISSTSRWANAVTLGLGLDWTKGKWVLGVFYQAALCQRVLFKSWNKDVSAGITNASVDFAGADWAMKSNDTTTMENTGRTLVATYGAKTPEFSVKPVIQTFMMSVKYCF